MNKRTAASKRKALILAAGYATRLYPLTRVYPKPLLKVKGKPIINYIIEKLDSIESLDEIIIVTNSKFAGTFKEWKRAQSFAKPITIIDDLTASNETRLGAIGDMAFVLKNYPVPGDLLVAGGDNLFDENIADFVAYADKHKKNPVMGVYDIGDKVNAGKYGVVKLNKNERIIDFKEKPGHPGSTLVAMCLYYFPKATVKRIHEYCAHKKHKSDAMGFYLDWLRRKQAVYGYVFKGRWYDIGDRGYYDQAQHNFPGNSG